ncbi:DUF4197 domain-containing protein [Undibacterium sp. TC4M20W]|uniref:DUF4197 domain-containing protein n=1 Tax=unclassified Undibacterium TaxID=2630295 RepID=UPI003BF2AF44
MSTVFTRLLLASSFVIATTAANAMSFADLSNQDASTGLKAALDKGSSAAVSKLGVDGGFLNNDKVKIQLPSILEKARPILQMTGKGQQLDELVVSMNRAAESAVPMAKPLLVNAVKSMSLTDAKNILTGGETSVTDFFREKTSAPLSEKFLPMVKGVTDKAGLSAKYNAVMGQAQKFGAVAKQEATVEGYVTQKAMDALFLMIAEEEKSIRQDPLGAGSKAISKVFSLLK